MDVSAYQAAQGPHLVPPHPPQTTSTLKPRGVPTNRGMAWIKSSWQLFKLSPWSMIALTVICGIIMALSNLVLLASVFITPFLMAGFVLAVAKLEQGGELEIKQLFSCLKTHPMPLLILGAIVFMATLVSALVIVIGSAIALSAMESKTLLLLVISSVVLGIGAMMLLLSLLSIAHAPCLVVLGNQQPKQALSLAIKAMLINWKPMTLYGLALTALYLLALIPAGLGLIVLWPVTIVSAYTSYQDIFTGEDC